MSGGREIYESKFRARTSRSGGDVTEDLGASALRGFAVFAGMWRITIEHN
jgi:hypothetical protein